MGVFNVTPENGSVIKTTFTASIRDWTFESSIQNFLTVRIYYYHPGNEQHSFKIWRELYTNKELDFVLPYEENISKVTIEAEIANWFSVSSKQFSI